MKEIELYNLPMNVKVWLSSASVQMMTPAERGGYLHLLMHCFQNDGRLPDDDAALAVLSDLREDWEKGSGVKLRQCFYKQRGGYLRHKRIDSVIKRIKEQTEKSRRGGLASAKSRQEKKLEQAGHVKGGSNQVDTQPQPNVNPQNQNKNHIQNQNKPISPSKHNHTTHERDSKPNAGMDMNEFKKLMEAMDMDLVRQMGQARAKLERSLHDRFKPVNGTRQVLADIVQLVVFKAAREASVKPFDEAMQWARNVFAVQNLKNPTGLFVKLCKDKLGYQPRGMMLEK